MSTFLDGPVPGVDEQVETYLQTRSGESLLSSFDAFSSAESLFIVNAGYNDYWWYVNDDKSNGFSSGGTFDDSALAGVADRVTDNLLESVFVVEGGATRLLVADLPDMSLFPEANGDSKSPDRWRPTGSSP